MSYDWKFLVRLKSGHRLFLSRTHDRLAVADNSGRTPDRTDDGVLWVTDARLGETPEQDHWDGSLLTVEVEGGRTSYVAIHGAADVDTARSLIPGLAPLERAYEATLTRQELACTIAGLRTLQHDIMVRERGSLPSGPNSLLFFREEGLRTPTAEELDDLCKRLNTGFLTVEGA